ncbi:MAG TPA: cyclase family protein [Dehalococcoidia bacterium]|nr:cyclase family protein [Dehalococcoidia bacterium]
MPDRLPSYRELPAVPGKPPHSAWGLFGEDDNVGLFNLITPERTAAGAREVQRGAVFPLNWDLEMPSPPLFGRGALRHTVTGFASGRDDVYDNFFPQSSSQWDALCHVGHPQHGFYNGLPAPVQTGTAEDKLGIHAWARKGIAGRGVLLDVARYRDSQGDPLPANTAYRIPVAELEATRKAAGVEIRTGDILLIRTGWMAWYLGASQQERFMLRNMQGLTTPGIENSEAMAEYLWDLHVVAAAADCPSLEAWPPEQREFGFLHQTLIGLFGLAIGEMWYLEELAQDCAQDGRYSFFLTSAPLNKQGGVGSPPNALAIK